MNWYKKATRGRYPGQLQGDEHRPGTDSWNERYEENTLVEGKEVAILKTKFKHGIQTGDWNPYKEYIRKLQIDGHSQNRIDSMVARAGIGKL